MNLKTDSNHKESTAGEIKIHEEQIEGLIGSLNDPFHGVAQNKAASSGIPVNIINALLSAKIYGTERVEQFIRRNGFSEKYVFMQYYSNIIEKKETEKGNIRPKRTPPGSLLIC